MSSEAHAHGHADDGAVHVHIAPARFYWGIFGALVLLTIATVKVSYYDFGAANTIVAMLIATMKGSLVAAFFMHLRYDRLFNTLAFLAAFLFLAIFILLTYDDLGHRAQVEPDYGAVINRETGMAAPGGAPATSATIDEVGNEAPPAGSAAPGAHPAEKPAEKKE